MAAIAQWICSGCWLIMNGRQWILSNLYVRRVMVVMMIAVADDVLCGGCGQ